MNEHLEIEVKYMLSDISAIRKKVQDNGWPSLGRCFETNIRFDDERNGLEKKRQLLRLRMDRKTTLTFKSKPKTHDPGYKVFKELEVTVESFDSMRSILSSLGFRERQVYEKWRETYKAGNALICLDEMPFADFIEIEGPKSDIDSVSRQLGFFPSKAITANYLEIFSHIRKSAGLDFNDVTFENFKNHGRNFRHLIETFENGATFSPSSP